MESGMTKSEMERAWQDDKEQIQILKGDVKAKDAEIESLNEQIKEKDVEIQKLKEKVDELELELAIYNS